MSITSNTISGNTNDPNSIKSRWGIDANEYIIDSNHVDLQDLMVIVSKNRATSVEGEVSPLSERINQRNAYLTRLGDALADLTKLQTGFKKDDKGSADAYNWMKDETGELLESLGYDPTEYASWDKVPGDRNSRGFYHVTGGDYKGYSADKQSIEGMIQKIKSSIDAENNESQLDMSRLQQLVDRRDQSYSTATTLMTAISDTRANLLRNF